MAYEHVQPLHNVIVFILSRLNGGGDGDGDGDDGGGSLDGSQQIHRPSRPITSIRKYTHLFARCRQQDPRRRRRITSI